MRICEAKAYADSDFLLHPLAPSIDVGSPHIPLAGGPYYAARLGITLLDGVTPVIDETVDVAALPAWRNALPTPLAALFNNRLNALQAPRPAMTLPGRSLPMGFGRPLIMGIVNVTPDSFSDGGRFLHIDAALEHAEQLMTAGADIIDIGGESTRPGAKPVWEEEERQRVLPVIEGLAGRGTILSIDSRRSGVIKAALKAGAQIINDISALTYDSDSMALAAESGAPVILMHALGPPQTMQDNPHYEAVVPEVFCWLRDRIQACEAAGIDPAHLIADPGIGFGKTVRHNCDLINGLAALHSLGVPLLLGVSRKRFIGALSQEEAPDQRLAGSLLAAFRGLTQGAHILRVHDVAETAQALRVLQGLMDAAHMGTRVASIQG